MRFSAPPPRRLGARSSALSFAAISLCLTGCPGDDGETGASGESSSTTDDPTETSDTNPSTTMTTTVSDTTSASADTTDGSTTDVSTTTDAPTTGETTASDSSSSGGGSSGGSSGGSTSGGPACGDGVIGGDEVCDGDDLGGADCTSEGFAGGTLACLEDCSGFDTSSCDAAGNACADEFLAEIGAPALIGNTEMEDDDLDGSCGGAGGNDLVVEFTAPEAGTYAFDTYGSDFDTEIALFTDCDGATELACNDDFGGTLQSQVILDMRAGQVVLVMIDGFNGSVGNVSLNIGPPPVCGDDVAVPPAEYCDGTDIAGMTCAGLGLGGDTPTCAADCSAFDITSCDPPTGYGNCWVVPGPVICTADEQCVLDGLGGALCLEFDCVDVSDCGPALPTGTAAPTCEDLNADGSGECYLSCELGETCPDGMVCNTGVFCAWPMP